MKKTISYSLLVAVTSLTMHSAAKAQKGFYVSAQGSPQLSVALNIDEIENVDCEYKAKASGTFGIGAGYNFNKRLGVATELMYSIERQRYSDFRGAYTQRLTYLKIPLLATFNTDPAHRVMFTAKAGPQLGVLLDAKISDVSKSSISTNTDGRYKKTTWGAMAGIGARTRIAGKLYVDAGLRLDGTCTNIETNKSLYNAETHALNAGFEVGVKYFLN